MASDKLIVQTVQHPRLSTETTWTALGDIALLDATHWVPVILSRSLTPKQIATEAQRIEAEVRAGAVAIGGFVSPPEKQVAQQLARIPDLKIVRVVPFSLYGYPLTEHVKARIRAGKTLLLSGCPKVVTTLTRANCIRTNGWILQVCRSLTPDTAPSSAPTPPPPPAELPPNDDPAAIFL